MIRFHKYQSYSVTGGGGGRGGLGGGGVKSSNPLTGVLNLQHSGKNLHPLLLPSSCSSIQSSFFSFADSLLLLLDSLLIYHHRIFFLIKLIHPV